MSRKGENRRPRLGSVSIKELEQYRERTAENLKLLNEIIDSMRVGKVNSVILDGLQKFGYGSNAIEEFLFTLQAKVNQEKRRKARAK